MSKLSDCTDYGCQNYLARIENTKTNPKFKAGGRVRVLRKLKKIAHKIHAKHNKASCRYGDRKNAMPIKHPILDNGRKP